MSRFLAWMALALAGSGAAGSLYLSMGLGLKACPLCFYQRTFVLAALAIVGLCLWVERKRPGLACLLSLPAICGGLGVAAFHASLVWRGKMICPLGVFEMGTAPEESLLVFIALAVVSSAGAFAGRRESLRQGIATTAAAIAIGLAFAWGCIQSAPLAPPTKKAYEIPKPIDTCQPVIPAWEC